MNTSGLPGYAPVTDCDFLAYSCAAARDFHPLPSSSGGRGCANQRNCERTELMWLEKFTWLRRGSQFVGGGLPQELLTAKFAKNKQHLKEEAPARGRNVELCPTGQVGHPPTS